MINDTIFEAIQWAQRYCTEYQSKDNDNVTQVFLKEMKEVYGQYLSESQIEHLTVDIRRYIQESERMSGYYKDYAPSQTTYEYLNYLSTLNGNEEKDIPENTSVFKMVYWAAMYCITRHSYAASYGNDVVGFLPLFEDSEIRFLGTQIDNYILEQKARHEIYQFKEYGISNFLPDKCWFSLLKFIKDWDNGKFVQVNTFFENKTRTFICFEDNDGYYREVTEYLKNPGYGSYISPQFITSTEILNKKTDIYGKFTK